MRNQRLISTDEEAKKRLAEIEADESAERSGSNPKFIQLGRGSLGALQALIAEKSNAARVLLFFVEQMSSNNAIMCSVDTIVSLTGLSRSSVFVALRTLIKNQWIDKLEDGSGVQYRINSNAFWTTHANFRKGSFAADIIVPKEFKKILARGNIRRTMVANIAAKIDVKK